MPADRKTKDAFTLIEFLIALVIIGFIVAILVGVFSSPLREAKLSAAASNLIDCANTFDKAEALHRLRYGTWEASSFELVSKGIISENKGGCGKHSAPHAVGFMPIDFGADGSYQMALAYDLSDDETGQAVCRKVNETTGMAADAAIPEMEFIDEDPAPAALLATVLSPGQIWGWRTLAVVPAEIANKKTFCYKDTAWGGLEVATLLGPM